LRLVFAGTPNLMATSLNFPLCSVCSLGQIAHKREKSIRLANKEAHAR